MRITGAETEIDQIKDDGKIERETNLDGRGPSQIGQNDTFLTPLLSHCRLPLIFCTDVSKKRGRDAHYSRLERGKTAHARLRF
jgi:hypothetical protein